MRKEFATSSKFVPSGDDRDTASVPITLPAPGRFSTIIVRLALSLTSCASSRINTSPIPPAANGTTIRAVLSAGHCASARAVGTAKLNKTIPATHDRLAIFMSADPAGGALEGQQTTFSACNAMLHHVRALVEGDDRGSAMSGPVA